MLGLLWIKDFYPRMSRWIERIPRSWGVPLTWELIVFMLFNTAISALAVNRRTQRHEGHPPANQFEVFLDGHYTDELLSWAYPNMTYVEDGSDEKQAARPAFSFGFGQRNRFGAEKQAVGAGAQQLFLLVIDAHLAHPQGASVVDLLGAGGDPPLAGGPHILQVGRQGDAQIPPGQGGAAGGNVGQGGHGPAVQGAHEVQAVPVHVHLHFGLV